MRQELCVKSRALFCFLNASNLPPEVENFFWQELKLRPLFRSSFYPCPLQACGLCLLSFPAWHFVSLQADPGRTPPAPQLTPWSLPWILKQTGYVLWLSTQPKGGVGGRGKQQLSQLCEQSGESGNASDLLTFFQPSHQGSQAARGLTVPLGVHNVQLPWKGVPNPPAGSVPARSPVTQLQALMEAEVKFFSTVPRFSMASCPLPEAQTGSHSAGVTASP